MKSLTLKILDSHEDRKDSGFSTHTAEVSTEDLGFLFNLL